MSPSIQSRRVTSQNLSHCMYQAQCFLDLSIFLYTHLSVHASIHPSIHQSCTLCDAVVAVNCVCLPLPPADAERLHPLRPTPKTPLMAKMTLGAPAAPPEDDAAIFFTNCMCKIYELQESV